MMSLSVLTVATTGIAVTTMVYAVHRQRARLKPLIAGPAKLFSRVSSKVARKKHRDSTRQPPGETAIKYRRAKRHLAVSGTAVATAVTGHFLLPPLAVVSAGPSLYASWPILRETWQGWVEERRVKAAAVDAVFVLGGLAMGYYIAVALTDLIYHSAKTLYLMAEDKSRGTLNHMFATSSQTAWLMIDGEAVATPVEGIARGQIVLIDAGQAVVLDGVVVAGRGIVDQHQLTGESRPVEKAPGDPVFAATVLTAGRLQVQVNKSGAETLVAELEMVLRQTANHHDNVQLRAQRIADIAALPTIVAGAVALVVANPAVGLAIIGCNYRQIAQLGASMSALTFLTGASRRSILIKDGRSLELLGEIDTIVFDKTGTLTLEQPSLSAIHCVTDWSESEVLGLAAAAEYRQTHPIARAILAAARAAKVVIPVAEPATYRVGHGIQVDCKGHTLLIGSRRFVEDLGFPVPEVLDNKVAECDQRGYSLVYLVVDDALVAALELHTTPRPEAVAMVRQFKEVGLDIHILSGDRAGPTRELAKRLGVSHWFADALPRDKAEHVRALRAQGRKVCFVGDGINDTIAMKEALVSVSISSAATMATDTAGIVLMNNDLQQLGELMALSPDYRSNQKRGSAMTLAAEAVVLSGVLFHGFGVPATVTLYGATTVAGAINALIPLWKSRREEKLQSRCEEKSESHREEKQIGELYA